jgi:hypothetical protein
MQGQMQPMPIRSRCRGCRPSSPPHYHEAVPSSTLSIRRVGISFSTNNGSYQVLAIFDGDAVWVGLAHDDDRLLQLNGSTRSVRCRFPFKGTVEVFEALDARD